MTSLFILLALLFGGIAVWAGFLLFRANRKPASRPHLRVIAPSPTDPWGAMMMRRRERETLRPGQRVF